MTSSSASLPLLLIQGWKPRLTLCWLLCSGKHRCEGILTVHWLFPSAVDSGSAQWWFPVLSRSFGSDFQHGCPGLHPCNHEGSSLFYWGASALTSRVVTPVYTPETTRDASHLLTFALPRLSDVFLLWCLHDNRSNWARWNFCGVLIWMSLVAMDFA